MNRSEKNVSPLSRFDAAVDTEPQNGTGASLQVFVRPGLFGTAGQARIIHPTHPGMLLEVFRDRQRVLGVTGHSQAGRGMRPVPNAYSVAADSL